MKHGNIFFDIRKLRHLGRDCIIGRTVRIRYPELVYIDDNCIIDDFTYISASLELSSYVHISSGCKIIGGKRCKVIMKSFSTLSPNVTIAAGSDDYISGIATPLVPIEYKGNVAYSNIEIGKHCVIGSGSVLLPGSRLEEGASVGALSLVNNKLDPWGLYAGIPAKKIKDRDRETIILLEKKFREREVAGKK